MEFVEFKTIPGYERYGVSKEGRIRILPFGKFISQWIRDGYSYITIQEQDSDPTSLRVNRAVALAWVPNPSPEINMIVNHRDGDKLNNWYENLEWTTYSENNYHAVNSGLRPDNIRCKIRNFYTKEVTEFSSVTQACTYMGFNFVQSPEMLVKKQFGALIRDTFEFRYETDKRPWFYETRPNRVGPARYMIIVENSDGSVDEVYSTRKFIKEYGLYYSQHGFTIPGLVECANNRHPDKTFSYRDSYAEDYFTFDYLIERKPRMTIKVIKGDEIMEFTSLRKAAEYFKVDRSVIKLRVDTDRELDGCKLVSNMPS